MHFTQTLFASQTSKGPELLEGQCARGMAMVGDAQVRATSRGETDATRMGRFSGLVNIRVIGE